MINQCNFIGRLGRDVETRKTQGGKNVANFTIAMSEKWKDKNTGEQREQTEWVRVVAFGRLGEICGEYLSKGSLVYISGKMRTRSWEKDGITRYITEVSANEMKMLSPKQNNNQSNSQGGYQTQNNNQYQPPPDDDVPF